MGCHIQILVKVSATGHKQCYLQALPSTLMKPLWPLCTSHHLVACNKNARHFSWFDIGLIHGMKILSESSEHLITIYQLRFQNKTQPCFWQKFYLHLEFLTFLTSHSKISHIKVVFFAISIKALNNLKEWKIIETCRKKPQLYIRQIHQKHN